MPPEGQLSTSMMLVPLVQVSGPGVAEVEVISGVLVVASAVLVVASEIVVSGWVVEVVSSVDVLA